MNVHGSVASPQLVERWILQSNDPSQPAAQMQAISLLREWSSSSPREVVVATMFQVLDQSAEETAQFYSLGTLGRMSLDETERTSFRQYLLYRFPPASSIFLRNKVAWILARFLWEDVPLRWTTLEDDLVNHLSISQPALYCKLLETVMEEFSAAVLREDPNNFDDDEDQDFSTLSSSYATKDDMRRVKDYFKNYTDEYGESTGKQANHAETNSLAHRLFARVVKILEESIVLFQNQSDSNGRAIDTMVLALQSMRRFLLWIDLSLVDTQRIGEASLPKTLEILLYLLSSPVYPAQIHVLSFQVLKEWNNSSQSASSVFLTSRCKLRVYSAVFEQIHKSDLLPYNGESWAQIEVVIEAAKFIDTAGQNLLHMLKTESVNATTEQQTEMDEIKNAFFQVLDLFFRAFSYDDIDVSAALFPLAGQLILEMEHQAALRVHMPQMLNILYQQLKYPADFSYDYEDEVAAEEMAYRADLSKLFGKMVRVDSDTCLQFVVETAQRMEGMSQALTQDVEVFLRLLYHFCEGVRPSPGLKVIMKNNTFCSLLTALHNSDITNHPHREVLCLYYETVVRYHPIFVSNSGNVKVANTPLLSRVLEAMSGTRGLLHSHARVRSRCCYLLLSLVKHTSPVLRPFVETAVFGIQALLSNDVYCSRLRPDDSLYLFETMGILLGKTGLEAEKQREFLVEVVTPHIERVKQKFAYTETDNETATLRDEMLASSIAAIAHLSKGFSKPPDGVQTVLYETVHVVLSFLQVAPSSEQVRNKTMIFLQRMMIAIGNRVLSEMPLFLSILTDYCDADDILFVSQLYNQLCLKFKDSSVPIIDGGLIPFLRKCQSLVPSHENESDIPPHLRTEQLAVKKLVYVVLQHVVSSGATVVLISPSNFGSLGNILDTMHDGATRVQDPIIQKTCLRFFRELVLQWLPPDSAGDDFALYGQGLLTFILKTLIPGMIDCFFQKYFEEKDVLYSRVLHEFAHILFSIRSHLRLVEGDQSVVLYRSIADSVQRSAVSSNSSQLNVDQLIAAQSASEIQIWLAEVVIGMHKQISPKQDLL